MGIRATERSRVTGVPKRRLAREQSGHPPVLMGCTALRSMYQAAIAGREQRLQSN